MCVCCVCGLQRGGLEPPLEHARLGAPVVLTGVKGTPSQHIMLHPTLHQGMAKEAVTIPPPLLLTAAPSHAMQSRGARV